MRTSRKAQLIKTNFQFLGICLFSWTAVGSAAAQIISTQTDLWTVARGRVQNLMALTLAPDEIDAAGNRFASESESTSFEQCALKQKYISTAFSRCAQSILEKTKKHLTSGAREGEFNDRIAIIAANFVESSDSENPTAWLKISAAHLLLKQNDLAEAAFDRAKKSFNSAGKFDPWLAERIELFSIGIRALCDKKDSEKKLQQRLAEIRVTDPQSQLIRSRMFEILKKSGSDFKNTSLTVAPEQKIDHLKRENWRYEQDREEIQSLLSAIRKPSIELEVISRIDAIADSYDSASNEWQAVANTIGSIAAKVDFLNRNEALLLPIEFWLAKSTRGLTAMHFDEDNFVSRSQMIVLEYARQLAHFLASADELKNDASRKVVANLVERLEGLNSSLGLALNAQIFNPEVQKVMTLQESLVAIESRLRRAQALLASFDLDQEDALKTAGNMKALALDLRSLQQEKRALILDFMKTNIVLNPRTQAAAQDALNKIKLLRMTISDYKVNLAGLNPAQLNSSQADQFFTESSILLQRLESALLSRMTARARQNNTMASVVIDLSKQVDSLRDSLRNFLTDSASELRPKLRTVLLGIDLRILGKIRENRLLEQIAQNEIRQKVASDAAQLKWTRDRLNDLRRIRTENLEWRVAK